MRFGYGVDLGGTTVKIAYFDEEGAMLQKWEIPTDTGDGGCRILPDIAASIGQHRAATGVADGELIGIGIGVPGPVNHRGVVNKCINLGWGVIDIPAVLGQLTGLPVVAGNDANVAALGECWKGGGQGCSDMVMATLGTGVGGGIVLGGKVVHGVNGGGGEIGHMVLNRNETVACSCGKRGCVEQYCSATGIVRLMGLYLQENDTPSSLRSLEKITCKDIFDASAAGDAAAAAVLDQVYRYMGEFLANICCVLDPEIVVLGGGVSKAGDVLVENVRKYYQQFVFHASHNTRFALAQLGNDAGAYGAFKLVLNEFAE